MVSIRVVTHVRRLAKEWRNKMLGNIGLPELLLILVVALVIFGPGKLPEVGKSLGKSIAEFKEALKKSESSIKSDLEEDNISNK